MQAAVLTLSQECGSGTVRVVQWLFSNFSHSPGVTDMFEHASVANIRTLKPVHLC